MTTEQMLNEIAAAQGWNESTKLDLALRYIEGQQSPDAWSDFLTGVAETESDYDQADIDRVTREAEEAAGTAGALARRLRGLDLDPEEES